MVIISVSVFERRVRGARRWWFLQNVSDSNACDHYQQDA